MSFTTSFYRVSSKKIPEAFNGLKIVFLTDLHNCRHGKNNKDLYRKILEISPDLVLIGGDMVVGVPAFHKIRRLAHFYSMLVKRFPVLYAFGNHERRLVFYERMGWHACVGRHASHATKHATRFSDYLKMMEKRGIRVLDNKSVYIEGRRGDLKIADKEEAVKKGTNGIRISGLNMDLDFFGKFWKRKDMPEDYIENTLGPAGGCDGGFCDLHIPDFEILLAHHPKYFKQYEKWGADLVLSGHLHGGVLRLPLVGGVASPDFTLFPRYSAGKCKRGKTTMIVSKGLGEHTIPFRIFDPRELVVVELERKQ